MLALIVGTEIPSTQIRSTTAKIVRIVKTADKLRGCKKEEYLKEIFKLSENINLSNRLTNQGGAQGACPPPWKLKSKKKVIRQAHVQEFARGGAQNLKTFFFCFLIFQ